MLPVTNIISGGTRLISLLLKHMKDRVIFTVCLFRLQITLLTHLGLILGRAITGVQAFC